MVGLLVNVAATFSFSFEKIRALWVLFSKQGIQKSAGNPNPYPSLSLHFYWSLNTLDQKWTLTFPSPPGIIHGRVPNYW
jgi:hypothetical protein